MRQPIFLAAVSIYTYITYVRSIHGVGTKNRNAMKGMHRECAWAGRESPESPICPAWSACTTFTNWMNFTTVQFTRGCCSAVAEGQETRPIRVSRRVFFFTWRSAYILIRAQFCAHARENSLKKLTRGEKSTVAMRSGFFSETGAKSFGRAFSHEHRKLFGLCGNILCRSENWIWHSLETPPCGRLNDIARLLLADQNVHVQPDSPRLCVLFICWPLIQLVAMPLQTINAIRGHRWNRLLSFCAYLNQTDDNS